MFGKNPIADSEYAYLKQVMPHRLWHYLLLLVALAVGSAFIWFGYDIQNGNTIAMMAAVILGIYWFFQFRIMQSAVYLANHDWQQNLPDELLGTTSKRTIILARVRAALRYHQGFIVLITLALLGFSLVLASYFLRGGYSTRGVLEYIGVRRTGYSGPWWRGALSGRFPDPRLIEWGFIEWLLTMGGALLAITFTNSILSTSIGLKAGRIGRAVIVRVLLLIVIFGAFFVLYSLRETPALTCYRSFWSPHRCDHMLFQMRLIDSFQTVTLSFLDAGTAMATGLHGCGPRGYTYSFWGGYQGRHLMAVGVTLFSQLVLSAFFLRRAGMSYGKKKKA